MILAACGQKEKVKTNPIVGKWEYERIERYSGEAINLQDSLFKALHTAQTGLCFSFSKDNVFKVTQKKPGGTEEFIAEQPYELPDSTKILCLKNTSKSDDNFSIIDLSDSILKINVFYSKEAYMVFRKEL